MKLSKDWHMVARKGALHQTEKMSAYCRTVDDPISVVMSEQPEESHFLN